LLCYVRKDDTTGSVIQGREARPLGDIPAYFLRIVPDRQSNLATGRSICQSSTSRPSTSRSAELIAASSSMQSMWIILMGRSCSPTINAR
jgi:hypothetical protein